MRVKKQDALAKVLRRLGVPSRGLTTNQMTINGRAVSASRAVVDELPWLHFGAASVVGAEERAREVALVAALADRVPALGVVDVTNEEIAYVRLPGWAFAALLRMVSQCDPKNVQTTLNEYLPLAAEMSPTDRRVGSGIVSALEEGGQFSSST